MCFGGVRVVVVEQFQGLPPALPGLLGLLRGIQQVPALEQDISLAGGVAECPPQF